MRLPAFKLERYLSRHEFSAPRLLCTSDCESVSIADLLALEEGAKERFMARNLGYTETQGDPDLRAGIAGLYAGVGPENVLVSAGAEEAIFLYMNAMLSPGDEIVVQCPAYQSLHEVARGIGCRVAAWTLSDADGWRPDIERLKDLVTPSTKAIVINSPHNPTGAQMMKEEFFAVKEIAEERDIHVFSDEVYRFLEHDPKDRLPPMADIYEKGISIGVMSKSFGLAGLRIGWTAAQDTGMLSRMAALKDYTTICCSAPSEFLSTLALRHREEIVERNLGIVRENLPLLDRFFARHADRFSWVRPNAGPIAFPRLLRGSAAAFCDEAVTGAGVLLLPSETYGYGDSHFRIGFARRDMPAALAALSDFLE
ncbi:aminotransferase class I and II [Methanofollis liminatans DSM 4140]|uniref:Aminotransferase class I and II n=1 Tax=Methanofollis liminatans DSM 4140 TaxID=28892 RepID=J1AQE0_9EURY|nr:aminotransferase class I/II-fold pyridoxal phosphate-dependent enzyme [Methanofollis liminatans]EJG07183.1 aminotransferase class I and II [Methanofollis liminatans DSM 4140]